MGEVRGRRWYALAVPYVCAFAAAIIAIVICTMSQRDMERRIDEQQRRQARAWCTFLLPLGDRYQAQPPKTADDKIVAETVRMLVAAYRC